MQKEVVNTTIEGIKICNQIYLSGVSDSMNKDHFRRLQTEKAGAVPKERESN